MKVEPGKVAVITGAASGIGLALSENLLGRGLGVMMADVDEQRLTGEVERLRRQHEPARVAGTFADVSDPASVEQLSRDVLGAFGAVHLVCNNAGLLDAGRSWERSVDQWRRILRTNIEGAVHGITTFVPLFLASGEPSHVVNISSTAAFMPRPGLAPYNASKAAVLSISETLAMELEAVGASIGVSVVMPGAVATRLARDLGRPEGPPRQPDAGQRSPEDIAGQIADAVEQDRFYVFTHPERYEGVRARVMQTLEALRGARP